MLMVEKKVSFTDLPHPAQHSDEDIFETIIRTYRIGILILVTALVGAAFSEVRAKNNTGDMLDAGEAGSFTLLSASSSEAVSKPKSKWRIVSLPRFFAGNQSFYQGPGILFSFLCTKLSLIVFCIQAQHPKPVV